MTAVLLAVVLVAGLVGFWWLFHVVFNNTVGRGVDALVDRATRPKDLDRFKRGT